MTDQAPRHHVRARHRQQVADEIDRITVVAQAKVLVRQLDSYLALMGEWIADGLDDSDDA